MGQQLSAPRTILGKVRFTQCKHEVIAVGYEACHIHCRPHRWAELFGLENLRARISKFIVVDGICHNAQFLVAGWLDWDTGAGPVEPVRGSVLILKLEVTLKFSCLEISCSCVAWQLFDEELVADANAALSMLGGSANGKAVAKGHTPYLMAGNKPMTDCWYEQILS